eukprot:2097060-Amphidinium_carterae.1
MDSLRPPVDRAAKNSLFASCVGVRPHRGSELFGRKHAKGRPRGIYEDRDVVSVQTTERVPLGQPVRPNGGRGELRPSLQTEVRGQAVDLSTYLSSAPWGITVALGGRPRFDLAAADSQSAPESTWARTSSMSSSVTAAASAAACSRGGASSDAAADSSAGRGVPGTQTFENTK